MNWESVVGDTYYQGRKLAYEARKADNAQKWEEYAELKTKKGSYTLAILGYMNASDLYKARDAFEKAILAYDKAISIAMDSNNRDLAVILTYRLVQIYENQCNWDAGITAFERLGAFCAEKGAHFQAADAYEHAAELMVQAGRDVSNYQAPIEHWERNIQYWKDQNHDHDAQWSLKHIDLYKEFFGIKS